MKQVIKIEDKAELVGFLRGIGTECRFVTLDTETLVRQRKTGNPYYGTIKIAKRNGLVGMNFVKACQRRYAELHNLNAKDVEYQPGTVWYIHCHTEDGQPLALCESKKATKRTGKIEKYLQYFPLRDLGQTIYVHPILGRLTKEQIDDMYARFVPEDDREEWKPDVITLEIDSIRSITFRKIKMLNETVSRLVGRLARWKKTRVDTRPAPVVAAED